MAKVCPRCGNGYGLSGRLVCADGHLCMKCVKELGIDTSMKSISELMNVPAKVVSMKYNINDIVSYNVSDNTVRIAVDGGLSPKRYETFKANQVVSFELLEDGNSVTKGGLGMAAVGALTFGSAGAIVGSVTGKKKTDNICMSLQMRITVKGYSQPALYIPIITSKVTKGGHAYKSYYRVAQDLLSILQIVSDSAKLQSNSSTLDPVDQLRKYKGLLDDGIITQEEFDDKKKELLSM